MICSCAKQMYRNNHDGSRDYKTKGDLRCPKCLGYGKCVTCPSCAGCGMDTRSQICGQCYGSGFVPEGSKAPVAQPEECPQCDGTGEVCYSSTSYGPCPTCKQRRAA
jgi:DnaJ-class molecular chaperone